MTMLLGEMHDEATRNRLLRRADWRFLLPDPYPAQSVCFAQGSLKRAVTLISDRTVDTRQHPIDTCDVAVAVNPDRATRQAAWAALRSGGAFYSEWSGWYTGRIAGVRQRLEQAGFERITCYWRWPLPGASDRAAQFWLPLDTPQLLAYFLSNRVVPQGRVQRAGDTVRRSVWRALQHWGLLRPIGVVARKPDQTQSAPDFVADLQRDWEKWGLGPTPQRLGLLLLTGGQHSSNKVITLVASERDNCPPFVVKRPRMPESIPALQNEAEVLRVLQAQGGVTGIPHVLFWQAQAERCALGETVLSGHPLYTQLRRENFRTVALQATKWLVHLAGQPTPCPRMQWWKRLVESVLIDFERDFGSVLSADQLSATRDRLAQLDDLPLVCEQRDFSPWNVLVNAQSELVVLDWESAELSGLPALDLFYFLTYLSFFYDGAMRSGRYRETYRTTSDATTFIGSVVAECVGKYAQALGLDLNALQALRLLVWLVHSRSDYRHLMSAAGGPPAATALRNSWFFNLWQEELLIQIAHNDGSRFC